MMKFSQIHPQIQALTMLFAASAAAEGTVAVPPPVPPSLEQTLGDAMRTRATGLTIEEAGQGQWKLLRKQAQDFIAFRRGRMPGKQKLLWLAECFSHPGENVFCDYIVERRGGHDSGSDPRGGPVEDLRVSEALVKGDLDVFKTATEGQIHRVLKQFQAWDPLQKIATAALESRGCPTVGLLTALGQKTEEFFPEKKFRDLAIKLYERAADCGDETVAAKARFRLSLLLVWAGDCKKADPLLTELSEQKNGDFVTRSLYWRAHCASQSGNKMLQALVRSRLFKEFPLSYHGVVLSQGKSIRADELLTPAKEPMVLFRSKSHAGLNPVVRGVEALQDLKSHDLALELLDSVFEKTQAAELPFRLYTALLYHRSGDRIGQFKTLAAVFRDEPTQISRATLHLFYPLHRFDVLKRYGSKLDPYFVAALIRQESGFNERARSPVGALGLMQLMPATARRMERVSKRELLDAKTNVRLGVKYFSKLTSRFKDDAELALAAYNAGPERVDKWLQRYPIENRMLFFDLIPYKETRDYVALISRNYYWYRNLYSAEVQEESRRVASSKGKLTFTMFELGAL